MQWWHPHQVIMLALLGLGLWLAAGALLLPIYGGRVRPTTTETDSGDGPDRPPRD